MTANAKIAEEGLNMQMGLQPSKGTLRDAFGYKPWSYWNTTEHWWLNRRYAWLGLGIKSEVGRGDNLTYSIPDTLSDGSKAKKIESNTSIFDPVICELCYTWWGGAPGGDVSLYGPQTRHPVIVDPFAGGSVRGIVAAVLGCRYWGCDLSGPQVAANREQAAAVSSIFKYKPKWVEGDSLVKLAEAPKADFIFSCPPYGDLEVYSKMSADISNMHYDKFIDVYGAIINKAMERLKPNRFAVICVANFRDKRKGRLRDFVGDTIRTFQAIKNVQFYNEVVYLNSPGSGPMRTNNIFIRGNRKVVKLHQQVLVFVKGDPAKAAAWMPQYKIDGQQEE